MKLTWLKNGFICKDLYAPFKLDKDVDYRDDLEKKYKIVMEQAKNANADNESLDIIDFFSTKILESLDLYYKADIAESNNIILELVKNIGDNPFAVNSVNNIAGNKRDDEGFYRVPREFANTYMIYLANYIAKKNNITLTTDYDFSWLCSNFMDYHGNLDDDICRGDDLTELGALTFANFIPYGIEKLSAIADYTKGKDEGKLRIIVK